MAFCQSQIPVRFGYLVYRNGTVNDKTTSKGNIFSMLFIRKPYILLVRYTYLKINLVQCFLILQCDYKHCCTVGNIRSRKPRNCNATTFIKPDQLDPWIKDQLGTVLPSTILTLQLRNFVSCGRACWQEIHFYFDPWSMDQADPVW